jgi:ribosomal protein S18 acetylase RimI-like enzyme
VTLPLNASNLPRPDFQIVPASREHLPDIAHLAGVIWRSYYPRIISGEQIEYMLGRMYDLTTLENELSNGICFDRLLIGDELAGFSSYGSVGQTMKLYKLYIHPDAQRRGLGTQMLHHLEQLARARGFPKVVLGVNKANSQAITAYEKNGFLIRESICTEIGGGFVMDDYIMEKSV